MGDVVFGVPVAEVKWLQRKKKRSVFIEGGTYKGTSARTMAGEFDLVITIEKDPTLHAEARKRFPLENVRYLLGDTREHLPEVLEQHPNSLIWLDAHWSGLGTYGEGDECPILDELELIFLNSLDPIILIDDARLFLQSPPAPHDHLEWPTIDELVRILPESYRMLVRNDVIYALHGDIFAEFRAHFQE